MPLLNYNNRTIYWRQDGNPKLPRLMLLNSLGTDQSSWDIVMPYLLDHFCILRMDKSGHGCSSAHLSENEHTIPNLGKDVLAVMDAAGWDKAHLCGVSIGGMTGIWLAHHAPHRFDRMVLSNTSAHVPPQGLLDRIQKIQNNGLSSITDMILGRFFSAAFCSSENAYYHSFLYTLENTVPSSYIGWCQAICNMDFRDFLKEITRPVLVITSDHDLATPAEMGYAIANQVPGAQLTKLPLAHLPFVEQPSHYAELVTNFLLVKTQETS